MKAGQFDSCAQPKLCGSLEQPVEIPETRVILSEAMRRA